MRYQPAGHVVHAFGFLVGVLSFGVAHAAVSALSLCQELRAFRKGVGAQDFRHHQVDGEVCGLPDCLPILGMAAEESADRRFAEASGPDLRASSR